MAPMEPLASEPQRACRSKDTWAEWGRRAEQGVTRSCEAARPIADVHNRACPCAVKRRRYAKGSWRSVANAAVCKCIVHLNTVDNPNRGLGDRRPNEFARILFTKPRNVAQHRLTYAASK